MFHLEFVVYLKLHASAVNPQPDQGFHHRAHGGLNLSVSSVVQVCMQSSRVGYLKFVSATRFNTVC